MREFSKGEIRKIRVLKKEKFSNKEISNALCLGYKRVDKFLGNEKNDKIGNVKIDKASTEHDDSSLQRGPGDSSNLELEKRSGESEYNDTGDNACGQITFTGGKKNMVDKKGSETTEENEYQCYNCDHTQGFPFTDCPKCGSVNSFEE